MRFAAVLVALISWLLMFPARAHARDLFQQKAAGADLALFPFWKQVLADAPGPASGVGATVVLAGEGRASCADDRRCVPAEWTAFLDGLRAKPSLEQMAAVDRWVNARPYVEDRVNWGVADYWETPGEFLTHGGDCEDYAVTKYFSLTRLGFPAEDLRLVIVNDRVLRAFHAVLAVRIDGQTWVLDNQAAEPEPFAQATRYTPIYALNQQGFWIYALPKIGLGGVTLVSAGPPAP